MMSDLEIFVFKQKVVADSRDVARMVGKQHKNLLRDIDSYIETMRNSAELKIEPSDFFIKSTYKDSTGRERPCYLCTRLGCDLIANKMTGEKGTLFTVAYVSKFRAMEAELTRREFQRTVKAPIRRRLTDAKLRWGLFPIKMSCTVSGTNRRDGLLEGK